ncbi:MAG: aldehyde dehydrogenase family protein [Pseudomonadota bacterium]
MLDKLFIDGEWIAGGETLPVIDPATGLEFSRVACGTAADIDVAVEAATRAFSGPWRKTSGRDRAQLLHAIADLIDARIDTLAELEVRDNGKPLPEARWDIEDTAGCFRYYAELAAKLDDQQGEAIDLPTSDFGSRVFYEPVGACALIIPWNYPMLMAAWKVAPALAAGCTCVLKPSELTPMTALELAAIAAEAGLPRGVLNVVTGLGAVAGQRLSEHPDIAKVAFTGSVVSGRAVLHSAAGTLKDIGLELGGKSAAIVFEDADIEAVVEWVMFGIFWNQGEVCSATSRLLIHESVADQILERLREEAERIPLGSGLTPGTLLGPLVSEQQLQRVRGFVDRARSDGIALLTGGGQPEGMEVGYFFQPTIFVDVPKSSELWREEVFGPVLAVRRFNSEADALADANDSDYGLAAAVFSKDKDRLERVARSLDVGIVWQNCSQPTFAEAPWGGTKQSGIGRELGPWGLQNYLSVKQVTDYQSARPWAWYLASD